MVETAEDLLDLTLQLFPVLGLPVEHFEVVLDFADQVPDLSEHLACATKH